ncbi:MAG: ABC transporter permease, partial [Anaerolineaceae bacterium]|nr:ABC transporter permease [Anaerolineaceae bacterium]
VIGESFAGERERHTLQTLLASRLPDRAILFGKLGSAIAYGWGMTLCVLALSAISANIAIGDGQVHFYPPILVLANVIISLLVAVLVGLMGVLVSLRARTVQEAQQMLFAAILIPGLVIQVLPILLTSLMPNGKDVIRQILEADFNHVIAVIIGFCSVVSLGLFLIVLARFQRARLTL